jgi:hypothetical protein
MLVLRRILTQQQSRGSPVLDVLVRRMLHSRLQSRFLVGIHEVNQREKAARELSTKKIADRKNVPDRRLGKAGRQQG